MEWMPAWQVPFPGPVLCSEHVSVEGSGWASRHAAPGSLNNSPRIRHPRSLCSLLVRVLRGPSQGAVPSRPEPRAWPQGGACLSQPQGNLSPWGNGLRWARGGSQRCSPGSL